MLISWRTTRGVHLVGRGIGCRMELPYSNATAAMPLLFTSSHDRVTLLRSFSIHIALNTILLW